MDAAVGSLFWFLFDDPSIPRGTATQREFGAELYWNMSNGLFYHSNSVWSADDDPMKLDFGGGAVTCGWNDTGVYAKVGTVHTHPTADGYVRDKLSATDLLDTKDGMWGFMFPLDSLGMPIYDKGGQMRVLTGTPTWTRWPTANGGQQHGMP